MSEYYHIQNTDREVIARIKDRDLAHTVADTADKMRPKGAPHSVQAPEDREEKYTAWKPSDGAGYIPTEEGGSGR